MEQADNKKALVAPEEARADIEKDFKDLRKINRETYRDCIIAIAISIASILLDIHQMLNR